MEAQPGGQERVLRAAGAGGLASGAALVTHIVADVSLRAALAAASLIVMTPRGGRPVPSWMAGGR